jgi:tetratricopeptide (TPR) repeat protein
MDERLRDLLSRGRAHYLAGEYGDAERDLAELAGADVDYADVFDMLGVIQHQDGRLLEAQAMFEKALRINPSYTQAALNLAVTYNDLGRYQEAKEIYDRVMASSRSEGRPLDPFAKGKLANMHADLGRAYHELGLFAEAVGEYQRAMALCPTFHDIRTQLGVTLRDMGNGVGAARELERVREENPGYLPARIQLGLTYFTLGRSADALTEWRRILAADPGNKTASMYVAMVAARAR